MTIQEKVTKITIQQLDLTPTDVTPSSSFVENLGADSLDIVELIMAFEEEFQIEIPDRKAEKMKTVQNAIDFITEELKK